jgi:hypothetical protein
LSESLANGLYPSRGYDIVGIAESQSLTYGELSTNIARMRPP